LVSLDAGYGSLVVDSEERMMRLENGRYCQLAPVEKVRIAVDDVPVVDGERRPCPRSRAHLSSVILSDQMGV